MSVYQLPNATGCGDKTDLRRGNVEMDVNFWIKRLVWKEVWMKTFAVFHVLLHVKSYPADTCHRSVEAALRPVCLPYGT